MNFRINLLVGTVEIIIMKLCNHANMQLYIYSSMQLNNYEIEFPDKLISLNIGNHSIGNYAVTQLCDYAIMQSYNRISKSTYWFE